MILVLVVVMVGGFFVARKVQDVAADFEDNPAMATARMIVKLNPEYEEVSTDEEAGTMKVRNTETGEVITVNFEDIEEGKFSFTTDEPGTTVVVYGTAVPPATVLSDPALTTDHEITIEGSTDLAFSDDIALAVQAQ